MKLLVFLGKFSFLQVYIHDPLHVCIMYLLNRKVIFGKRYQPKRNFVSSKIKFSFLFGNFGALLVLNELQQSTCLNPALRSSNRVQPSRLGLNLPQPASTSASTRLNPALNPPQPVLLG